MYPFWVWFLSPMFRFIHVVSCISSLFLVFCWVVFHFLGIPQFIFFLILFFLTLIHLKFFILNFILNVYLFLRESETEHEWGRGWEREGDTESEAGSRLWAVSTEPDARLEPTVHEIMTWAEVGSDWATQEPSRFILLKEIWVICQPLWVKCYKNSNTGMRVHESVCKCVCTSEDDSEEKRAGFPHPVHVLNM